MHNNRADGARALRPGLSRRARRGARHAQLHGLARRVRPAPDEPARARMVSGAATRSCGRTRSGRAARSSPTATGAGPCWRSRPSAADAWEYENRGMIDAVGGPARRRPHEALLRRVLRLRLVVEQLAPARGPRPRARALRVVDPRRGRAVDPRRLRRRAGDRHGRRQPRRLPRGQLRAQAGRPVPARARPVGQLRPGHLGRVGRARRGRVLQQPDGLPRAHGRRPPGLAARAARASCSSAVRGSGRTRPARSRAPSASPACCRRRASATSSTSGATTSRTTGPPGVHNSPIICHGSADGRDHAPDRDAARHRGGLADARSRRSSRASARSRTPRARATA